jgi:hypothetical protein
MHWKRPEDLNGMVQEIEAFLSTEIPGLQE